MIAWFFKFIVRRATVGPRGLRFSVRLLKAILLERYFIPLDQIPDSVALVIVQEACRRAAAKEKDGRARYGEFDREVEFAADNIIAAFKGAHDADPRIKGILSFNKLI
jgi:hypothetical protein